MKIVEIIQPLTREEIKDVVKECLSEFHKDSLPDHYSKKGFAKKIGKSTSWIDEERRQGNLDWIKIGGNIRIPHSEYLRLINQL